MVWSTSRYSRILKFNNIRRFSSSSPYDVIVVGGGPGGYVAAIKAAQLGLKTACVEGRGTLGGTCLNVGCIPSKALLHNSHLYHEAKHEFAPRGIKVSNVELDLDTMHESKNRAMKGLTDGVAMLLKMNKVTWSKGWGKVTGANEVTVAKEDGTSEVLGAKNIIIATGSESTPLPGVEIDEEFIVSSTGALDFPTVPENLLVVGGGVIGLELGSVWSRLGSNVEVVEFLDRLMPGMDGEVAKTTQQFLKKQGINFTMKTAVKSATKENGKVTVVMEKRDGGEQITKVYDRVLIAIGRRPYTEGLGLEEVGVEMEGRMVKINDHWQSTSHPSIYGIGDVVKGAMLAHKAEEEGIAVAEILAGGHGHVNYDAIPGVIYTMPEVASVGKTEEELKEAGVKYAKGKFNMAANSRDKTISAGAGKNPTGWVKILTDKETDRMLGAHIVAPNAGEMIAEACIALEYGASSEDIGRTCHAHPTMSEAFKEACLAAHAKAIHG